MVDVAAGLSGQYQVVPTRCVAGWLIAFVLDRRLRVDRRRLTAGRDLRVEPNVFGRHVGLGRRRGDLVPDLGLHRDQPANRRSLDRVGDDGLHGWVVSVHGNDPWKHVAISRHDSGCFDESCCCNHIDSAPNGDLLGNLSVGAANGNR